MINVTIGESKTQSEKPFPKLMTNGLGCIRYFISKSKSIIVKSAVSDDRNLAEFDYSVDSIGYTDYNEPITLQNA